MEVVWRPSARCRTEPPERLDSDGFVHRRRRTREVGTGEPARAHRGTRRPQVPASGPDAGPRAGDPRLPRRGGLAHRRAPRAEPRGRRAHHRDPPGVPLAARHRGLRHRPPVLRAQAAHRAPRLHRAAHPGRAVRLPEPSRVRARRRRELPRLGVAVVGGRHRHGPRGARRARPAHRGRHRRRRPHRRDGVGGPEQHRRRARPCRSSSSSTTTSAPTPRPAAASPTTSPPCARPAATSASSTGASTPWPARRSSVERCTRRCTGSRRASRTSSRRRACSRTSG